MRKKRVPSPEEQFKHLTHRGDVNPVQQGENEYTDIGLKVCSPLSPDRLVKVLFFVKPGHTPKTGD